MIVRSKLPSRSRRLVCAVLLSSGLALIPASSSGKPGARAKKTRSTRRVGPAPGELRVGVVGWSAGEKMLAVSTEKILDAPDDREATPRKRRPPRRKLEVMVSLFACPGFEMQGGLAILDGTQAGAKARAAGWKEARAQISVDGFEAAKVKADPAPLALEPFAPGATRLVFDLPGRLGAAPGSKLELTSLEGNPVLTLLRPGGDGAEGVVERIKMQEFEAGAFETREARCTLQISPSGRCLALLCAQGRARPYLGAYLLESRRLRIPAR